MKRGYWLILLSVGAATFMLLPLGPPASGASQNAEASGGVPIASTTIVFADHSRTTPASNGSPAEPYRSLSTLIVYPKPSSGHHRQFPLIVYSHGFGATASSATPTLDALAAHGYVVAALDFPLSTTGLPGGLDLLDFKNQPGDVSFIISQMLKLNRSPNSPVYHEIQVSRIGAVGHSLGAVTTLAVSYNSCCRDNRVDAAVEMDGELNVPIGPSGQFAGTYFKGHNPPLLMINGTKDTLSPYGTSQALYTNAPVPSYLLSLIGAPHEGFAMAPWFSTVNNTIAAFFGRYLKNGQTVGQIKRAGTEGGITTIEARPR